MARTLERGDVFFAYKPRVDTNNPRSIEDVQRFYMILSPDGASRWRRLRIGRKRLPDVAGHERFWAVVDRVGRRPAEVARDLEGATYQTKTRGERFQPPARPVAVGRYAIVEHGQHVHIAYAIALPEIPGDAQRALRIERRASYIAAVANPSRDPGSDAGFGTEARPAYPKELLARFDGRRFAPLEPSFLDHEGCEVVLIGTSEAADVELGVAPTEREQAETEEILAELGIAPNEDRLTPLLDGAWD
jgi:hypothetical protein